MRTGTVTRNRSLRPNLAATGGDADSRCPRVLRLPGGRRVRDAGTILTVALAILLAWTCGAKAAGGPLYTVGKGGVHRIGLDGTVEHLLDLHKDSYDLEIRDDRLYVTETTRGGDLFVYSLEGDYITSIPTPAVANEYYKFVALPGGRFALLDNRNDKVFFIDERGSLLATTKILSTPDSLLQILAGIVVGNRLILTESGNGQVLAIDLATYQASSFKNLSYLPKPLSDIAYADGKYYVLAGERLVYSFTDSGSAVRVGETGGVYVSGICILGGSAYISTNSANKVFELDLGTGVAGLLASGIHYPRDIECVPSGGEEAGDCCGFRPGDRVVLRVDQPLGPQGLPAVGLYAGTLGTVVCCDYDDPDWPLFVSWDGWTNGTNSSVFCESPVISYIAYSGWWMSCAEIEPRSDGICRADLVPYLSAVWTFSPRTIDLCAFSEGISFTYGVKNQGCAPSDSYSVCFYASTDATITRSDYLLGSISKDVFAPDESGTWITGSFPLDPGQLPPGSYYVGFIVDCQNQVQESVETNNVGVMSGRLTVVSCDEDDGHGGGDGSGPLICIGGECFPLDPDPSAPGASHTYIGSVELEIELNFRARLSAEVTPIPEIGGTWTAWLDPAEIGPGTATTTLWVRAENLDLSAFPGGTTGVQVATVTIFYVPIF